MADYDTIMKALRNAHAAGDTQAAARLARMAQEARAQGGQQEPPGFGDRAREFLGGKWTENVWGKGEADTPGERAGQAIDDVFNSFGSRVISGWANMADMPANIASAAGDKVAGVAERMGASPGFVEGLRASMDVTPFGSPGGVTEALDTAVPYINEYEPKTTAGEYAGTAGDFTAGAVLGPGGMTGNILRYGILPGLASEAAGQATEGTAAEPYARIAAALATPLVTGRPTGRVAPPGADPEDVRMAQNLMDQGIRPTAGQVTGNRVLRALEGSLDNLDDQAKAVTSAAMRTTGSAAPRATPDALAQASDDIVGAMNAAVDGISFAPTAQMAGQADDVLRDYMRSTAKDRAVPDVQNIADEIIDAATRPGAGQIALSTLKDWRSRLGKLLQGSDGQTREAAWGLRTIIDDATEAALNAAGRADDVQILKTAREQYRNWLAIADAATRVNAENGILSPTQLHQSVIRTQGRRNVAVGNTTPLGELSRSSAGVLRPAPTVNAGGVRMPPQSVLGGGLGMATGMAMGGWAPIVGALTGMAAPVVGQAVVRSQPVQSLMMDPVRRIAQTLLAAPGASQQAR